MNFKSAGSLCSNFTVGEKGKLIYLKSFIKLISFFLQILIPYILTMANTDR